MDSLIKLRKKKTRGDVVEIIDTMHSLDVELYYPRIRTPNRRFIQKKRTMCMMLWGATAFFGVVRSVQTNCLLLLLGGYN